MDAPPRNGQPRSPSALHGLGAHAQDAPIDVSIEQQKRKRGRPRKTLLLTSPIREQADPARPHRRPAIPLNTHSLFASIALAAISSSGSSALSQPHLIDWAIGVPGLTPLNRIYSPSRFLYSVHVPTLQSRGASTFSQAPVAQLRRHPNARNLRTVYHSMMELADVSHPEKYNRRPQYFPEVSDPVIKLDPACNPILDASGESQPEIVVQSDAEDSADRLVKLDPSDTPSISPDKQPPLADRTETDGRLISLTPPEQTTVGPASQDQNRITQPATHARQHNSSESQPPLSPPSKLPTPTTSPLKPKRATPNSASGSSGFQQPPASPSGRQKRVKTLAAKSAALTTALAALRAQREREQQHASEQGAMNLSGSLHDIAGGLRRFVSEVNGAPVPAAPTAEMQPALVEHLQTLKGAGKFAVPPGQVASAIKKRRMEAIDTALGLMGGTETGGRKQLEAEMDGEKSSGTEKQVHDDVVVKEEVGEEMDRRIRNMSGRRSRATIAPPDGTVLSSGSEWRKRTRSGNLNASSSTRNVHSRKQEDASMTGGAMDATALLSSAAELLSQTEAAEALAAATLSGQSLSGAELADLHSVPSSPVSDPVSDEGQSGLALLALLAAEGVL